MINTLKKSHNAIVGKFCRHCGLVLALLWAFLASGCGTCHHLPSANTETIVNLKDSTILHIIDSIRITEASRYKDWAGLLDTLTLKTEDGSVTSRSYCDTTRNILAGELEVKPRQEKTRIVYKTKLEVKDSIRVVEKPYPVEVEKIVYKTPKFWKVTGVLGIILTGLLLIFLFLKLTSKFPL